MKRTWNGKQGSLRQKPVEKVELSEKHIKLRAVLTVAFLIIGIAAIVYGVSSFFGADAGWAEIESVSQNLHCGDDFVFLYELGRDGVSAAAEKKAVTGLYSQATTQAYKLFSNDAEFEDVQNIYTINRCPNEEIEVDEGLYRAFSLLESQGDRSLYLAPVYAQYGDLFTCNDDSQTVDYDPYVNEEVAASYREIAAFANDKASVDLELLEGNKVRLKVSQEYLDYAKENGISSFIDFFWLKNAFVADYLADFMVSGGFTHGCISSYDGFARNLDGSGTPYSLGLYDRSEGALYPAAVMEYTGPAAAVSLRNYPLSSQGLQQYYQYDSGEIRTSYLDVKDGLCKSSRDGLTCYGKEKSCAQLLLRMIPIYIADSFQKEQLAALKEEEIYSVYCENRKVLYNDPTLTISNLYQADVRYEAELVS